MSNLEIFKNEEFGEVRTVLINDVPHFVGNDIATILGYSEPRSTVSKKVDSEDRGVAKIETPSGIQEMTVINESGLYSLVLGSKLPNAKKFKRWVTSEVLPTIRKHGAYSQSFDYNSLPPEMQMFKALFDSQAKIYQETQEGLNKVNQRMDDIKETMVIDPNEWREETNSIIRKIALNSGGGKAYSDVRVESYSLLEKRFGFNLKKRLENKKRLMSEKGVKASIINNLCYMDIIQEDKKLKEGYIAIVREMAFKYLG